MTSAGKATMARKSAVTGEAMTKTTLIEVVAIETAAIPAIMVPTTPARTEAIWSPKRIIIFIWRRGGVRIVAVRGRIGLGGGGSGACDARRQHGRRAKQK